MNMDKRRMIYYDFPWSLQRNENDQGTRNLGFACHEQGVLGHIITTIISIDICDLHLHFSDGVVDKTEHPKTIDRLDLDRLDLTCWI